MHDNMQDAFKAATYFSATVGQGSTRLYRLKITTTMELAHETKIVR